VVRGDTPMVTKKRYYVSVNFICDTDGSEKDGEPSVEKLNEAFRSMIKDETVEFEIWDTVDQEEDY